MKINVAYIVPNTDSNGQYNLKVGGAENQIKKLLQNYDINNIFEYTLITKFSLLKNLDGKLKIYQCTKTFPYLGIKDLVFIIYSCYNLINLHRLKRISIISPQMIGIPSIPAIIISKIYKIPILAKVSGSMISVREKKSHNHFVDHIIKHLIFILRKYLIKRIHFFQSLNTSITDELKGVFGVNENRIFHISNGIEDKQKDIKSDLIKIKKFGFVGRLEPVKNIELLITAFHKFNNSNPNSQLLIYGEGSKYEFISNYISKFNLQNAIILKGFEKDLKKIYNSFDIFILTSQGEGISNTLLEAMSYGVPVLASDVAGNNDIIIDNFDGILFINSVEALFSKMKIIFNDIQLANNLRKKALIKIKQKYSFSVIIPKLEDTYKKIR